MVAVATPCISSRNWTFRSFSVKYILSLAFLSFLLVLSAWAQTAGTIAKTTISTISATAGVVSCTFTSQQPALPTGVAVSCKAGTAILDQTSVIPVGNTSGIVGSFHSGSDAITWILKQPTTGVVTWEVAANGVSQSGTF